MRMHRAVLAALMSLPLAAAAQTAGPRPAPAKPAPAKPAPAKPAEPPPDVKAVPIPTKEELDELMAATDEIAKTVSKLRGLPVKKKIDRGVLSREQITKRLLEKVDEEYKPDEISQEERALKRLGLLPADAEYKQLVLDLLTEQVAGFYDPTAKELYLADWIETASQRMVMAHEIDHALQDQTFDLEKFTKPSKDNGDAQLAKQALVEGDGMALMIEFLFSEQGSNTDPWGNDQLVSLFGNMSAAAGMAELDKAPLFLREQLLFPYGKGLLFIASIRKTQPWSAIDAVFKSPPLSTEQILHPEKYAAKEKPIAVKAANLPSLKGWKKTYENVMGELLWDVFLREHGVDATRAATAAAGWGGDRLVVYAPAEGTDLLAVNLSAWDAEMDAIEAFDSLVEAVETWSGAKAPDEKADGYAAYTDGDGKVTLVERKGKTLLLVVGAAADQTTKLRKDVWAKWKAK
jgi:hypothetical protein